MRDLDPPRAEFDREINHARRVLDIAAMDDGVDGERQALGRHPGGDLALLGVAALVAADPIGLRRVDALDRKLDVIEAGGDEAIKQVARQADAGGDQIGVEPDLRRRGRSAPRDRGASRARRRKDADAARPSRRPQRRCASIRPCSSPRAARRARPGWSNRGRRAGSDGSVRRAGPRAAAAFRS